MFSEYKPEPDYDDKYYPNIVFRTDEDGNIVGVGPVRPANDGDCEVNTYRESWLTFDHKSESNNSYLDAALAALTLGIMRDKKRYYTRTIQHFREWKENSCKPGERFDEREWSEVIKVPDKSGTYHEWIPDSDNQGITLFGHSLGWWKEHSVAGTPEPVSVTLVDTSKPTSSDQADGPGMLPDDVTGNTKTDPKDDGKPNDSKAPEEAILAELSGGLVEGEYKARVAGTQFTAEGFQNIEGCVLSGKEIKTGFLDATLGRTENSWYERVKDNAYYRVERVETKVLRYDPSTSGKASIPVKPGSEEKVTITYGYLRYILKRTEPQQ